MKTKENIWKSNFLCFRLRNSSIMECIDIIAGPFKRFSLIVLREYDFVNFKVEKFRSPVSIVTGKVA